LGIQAFCQRRISGPGWMFDDETQGAMEQRSPRLDTMPGARAARVRQWNDVEFVAKAADAEFLPDDLRERHDRDEFSNCELSDWNNELGAKDLNLGFQPARAASHFIRRGYAIAACCGFPRKASADRGHIDVRAKLLLAHSAHSLKPAEKGLPRSPRKWPSKNRLFSPGSLTHADYSTHNCTAADGRAMHARTECTRTQRLHVLFKLAMSR